jgi:hypothetical protein
LEQARWVEAQASNRLPVPYFHLVFTVPQALHPFFLVERRHGYALLFQAALEALHEVCQRRLGSVPGTTAVLHTWSQTLTFHPHIHCIVTGGGLDPTRASWIASRPGFLVPVRVLSKVFRGKLLERFDRALTTRSAGIGCSLGRRLLRQAAAKSWVVYSKAPLAGPQQVLRYLGRYTHRIALGNERLVALQDAHVTFRYRDRQRGNERKVLTLPAAEFIRRFLLHVLPRGFVRVRHYGLQANGCRTELLARARQLLNCPVPASPSPNRLESWQALLHRLTGFDASRCPYCGIGRLLLVPFPPPSHHSRGP